MARGEVALAMISFPVVLLLFGETYGAPLGRKVHTDAQPEIRTATGAGA